MADEPSDQPRQLMRCTDGFLDPRTRQIVKNGQLVPADHPIVKGRARHFEPAEAGIELATRAPGEIRVTARRPDAVVAKATKPAKRAGRKSAPPPARG